MIPPLFLFPSFYWKLQIGRPNSNGFQDLQFPFLSMCSKWLPLTPCCFEEVPFYLMKCLSFHFCPGRHKTCQAWAVPGELKGKRLKLHKMKLFYARLVLSSTLEFVLGSSETPRQSLCEIWRRGGAASSLCDVRAAWAGFNWAGLSRLCSGQLWFSQVSLGRAWKGRKREIRDFAPHCSCNLRRDRDSHRAVSEFGCRHRI